MPDHSPSLNDRVALVTGGSRGIGRAIALALAAAGAAVAVNYRQREREAADVVAAIEQAGGRAFAVRADVSVAADVKTMIDEVTGRFGSVDVLVNNAGTGNVFDIDTLTEDEFDRTLAVNLKSAFLCTQAVLPAMRAKRWGRVVNLSSAAARGPGLIGVHYNASKAGLEGLTRGYAARVAREGVTVNAVAPGPIDTEMAGPLKAANIANKLPVGRLGEADEVAEVVLMVVGNAFITGQTIPVNGGVSFI
ncbi:SDR family NAD(P)-dependent oxidoreductase [Paraburkholderia caballeronis]|uniref:3-oxoacyl-[acyl-carrier protein] reductase n=1 Tax=Paraburkholderia caballeronis TaxID=416943 RepID=A0A1H7FWY8_9BURK|nr:SDR family NAD(P)-dependent oxidoreductase [Paraburkholderia caballeronis]PXW24891.1 3-oxoacyl-[acyl-carrier protein] reductase [Paraburkholderia caballeronis]PXX00621.1 3-oxoacyl-[acyl-carrier protein] reductase [Paraburkholderia caballeronis]RAJ98684.1 3-oxoacyl-[acyl-carrier protein] reductase [Paraburkholderia caballeronis]SEE70041.1 3-oxoacyl-[acyl-carrier protein] reductase [Paraburkholderia caballeronis]SEK27905.1 3-oxoacyl-[acyl-carrier protein] reductase [Paraburkholderia caballero